MHLPYKINWLDHYNWLLQREHIDAYYRYLRLFGAAELERRDGNFEELSSPLVVQVQPKQLRPSVRTYQQELEC